MGGMKRDELIQRSPKILGGTPVFAGTRVPIHILIDYLKAGDDVERFLDDFPTVKREQVTGVLEIAGELLLAEV